ncbi:MAG: zf-HC2 domain-containing protein [Planctomycetota bacterium]|nr:zf-HC2 domain-containing protein [Planctomycetota bacterium]
MSDDLRILLMGYLDGELGEADRQRVEQALAQDAGLRAEYEAMKELTDLTSAAAADALADAELDHFWNDVYNQLERHTAWVLLLVGLAGLLGWLSFLFFASANTHWLVKLAGAAACLGSLLLLWSVWRERQKVVPHDRYHKEVHR